MTERSIYGRMRHHEKRVQEYAGHRRTGSTEGYKRTGVEELKANIEQLHSRQ